jgi:hypothetical protein
MNRAIYLGGLNQSGRTMLWCWLARKDFEPFISSSKRKVTVFVLVRRVSCVNADSQDDDLPRIR